MGRDTVIAFCVSQFHNDPEMFELLVCTADCRERGFSVSKRALEDLRGELDKLDIYAAHAGTNQMTLDLDRAALSPGFEIVAEKQINSLVEGWAEVKATSDGCSDQPIADIVAGVIEEIQGTGAPVQIFAHNIVAMVEALQAAQEFLAGEDCDDAAVAADRMADVQMLIDGALEPFKVEARK